MSTLGMKSEILNIKSSNCGYNFHCELKNVPVTFVNAIRRILLSDIPTVVLRNVEIIENTTNIPHEMLKHRVELMPVNVLPTDTETIRETVVELHALEDPSNTTRTLYSTDFTGNVLMNDRDLKTPILFLDLPPGKKLHIRARLARETKTASQVSLATTKWHIDTQRAENDRKLWVEKGGDPQVFDNFYIQKSYSRDDAGRPNWFDIDVKSIGVLSGNTLVKTAVQILREMVDDYMKEARESIERFKDDEYRIAIGQGGHTVCALLQEVIYNYGPNINFVSYDIPHPLRAETVIRLQTKNPPETVLDTAHNIVREYCSFLEKALS